MTTSAKSHDRYARAFVYQRVREVFNALDSKHDGYLDEEELRSHLWSVGYRASKKAVHDMIWEVDDRSTGVITLQAIRKVLKRLQRDKKRMPGTGTNLLRTLIEFMMFDSDGSAAIELEEIQQMFYVYYGYKGRELDEKVNSFSRQRTTSGEIDFSEFLVLMDTLGLVPVIGEQEAPKAVRSSFIPKVKSPRRKHSSPQHSPREQPAHQSPRQLRLSPRRLQHYQEDDLEDGQSNTPRLPPIASPRARPTERQLSEMKFRQISSRFQAEQDQEKKQMQEEEARKAEEAPGFTIRNALMK